LAAIVCAMLFRLPFAFAQHLDAGAVHQQMQPRRGRDSADRHLQRLLAPAYRAVVRHRPVKSSQFQQALRHAHGLAQWQIEEALDAQAELDRPIAELLATPALAAWLAMPSHVRIKPDEQRAARLEGSTVGLPVGSSVFLMSRFHPIRLLPDLLVVRWLGLIYATKPNASANVAVHGQRWHLIYRAQQMLVHAFFRHMRASVTIVER